MLCCYYNLQKTFLSLTKQFFKLLELNLLILTPCNVTQCDLILATLSPLQEFPPYPPAPFSAVVPPLSPTGIDLLRRHLVSYPKGRITAEDAMRHEYFSDLDDPIARPSN